MPSQIVTLPTHVISSIASKKRLGRALSAQDMWVHAEERSGFPATLRFTAEPLIYCPDAACALRGDVFVVLLTSVSTVEAGFFPLPLPDCTVFGLLQTVEEVILGLDGLSGHECMEIARAFEAARKGSTASDKAVAVAPEKLHQREALAMGSRLAERFSAALNAVEKRLETYRQTARRSGSDFTVGRLSWQAELGQLLHLRNTVAKENLSEPYLLTKSRRGDLRNLHLATENLVHAYDLIYENLEIHGAEPRRALDLALIRTIHETIVRGLPGRNHRGAWRQGPVNIKSPITGDVLPCPYSADDLETEMQRFIECYDKAIWSGMSPLLRAGLAHQQLVKVHPFTDGNGRCARMVMQAILMQSGWPALPLEIAFTEHRHRYLSAVTRSIDSDDPAPFIEFLFVAVETALNRGIRMMKELRKEQDRLVAALVALDLTPGPVRRLADWALCNLMTPGAAPDWIRNATLLAEDELDRTGLVDALYHLGGVSYSAKAVRRLMGGQSLP